MIELLDGLYLDADDNQYIVFRQRTSPKGTIQRYEPKYYSTLRSALLSSAHRLSRTSIEKGEVTTINELVERYDEITRRLEELIHGKVNL